MKNELAPGHIVSHYEIVERMGEGELYLARDRSLDRSVVLKFLPSKVPENVARLQHPYICHVHELGESEGRTFIATEYVRGETLAKRLEGGAIPLDDAMRIASEIAEALETAHAQGVVHGELKPSSIILTVSGHVKVMDFGLADRKDADPRSDIFSLGTVLYEMLVGDPPPAAPEALSRFRNDVPELLEHVVRKMLAKRPEDRYQLVHEMLTDLAQIREAYEPGDVRRSLPFGWLGAVVAVVLAGLAGLTVWWLASSRGPAGRRELSSVAVLPLRNLSADPLDSDYLAEGISRAVTTKLTQAGLRVTPWDTARRYGESPERAEVIARELNVDAALVGTFELAGSRILTTLSLVDAESGLQFWADEFEEPNEDVFQVQRRIALGAARSLKRELTGEEEEALAEPESESADAYDRYLQGAHLFQEGGEEATEVAYQYFTRALELDPGLAEAHVGLGAVHYARYYFGWGGLASLDQAEASYERALERDPRLMRARRGLIIVNYFKGRSEACLAQGELAARFGQPDDVETLLTRGTAYNFGGLFDRAAPLLRRALAIDPVNAEAHYQVIGYFWLEEPERAIETGNAYFRRFGEDGEIHMYVAWAHQLRGDYESARRHYQMALGLGSATGDMPLEAFFFAGILHERLGEREQAEAIWRRGVDLIEPRLEAHPDNVRLRLLLASFHGLLGDEARFRAEEQRALSEPLNAFELYFPAVVHARLGETERAIELLRRSVRGGLAEPTWEVYFPVAFTPSLQSEAFNTLLEEYQALQKRLRDRY